MKTLLTAILLSALLLLATLSASSQKHAANWFFGNKAAIGFDFSTDPPQVSALSSSQMYASEGCASISDPATGNLLFYTNGNTVYNRKHMVMTNGSGLNGNGLSAQSTIIVPLPGDPDLYYIFTVDDWIANRGMYYSIVDMSASSGDGAVTTKNVQLDPKCQERVVASYHANCRDVWILAHQKNTDTFSVYLLTPSGLGGPYYYKTGSVQSGNNRFGGMKFSADGKWLASALGGGTGSQPVLELYRFNNRTGAVSDGITLLTASAATGTYSAEFSPSGNKLYSVQFNSSTLHQFDLSSGVSSTIIASGTLLNTTTLTKSVLQAGPDGKIYIAGRPRASLDVIHEPERSGNLCNFQSNYLALSSGATAQIGLPNFLPVLGRDIPPHDTVKVTHFCPRIIRFGLDSNLLSSRFVVKWDFGDTASGTLNQYTGNTASHTYSKTGPYQVKIIVTDTSWSCSPSDTEFVRVLIPAPSSVTYSLGPDTVLCNSLLPLKIDSKQASQKYLWSRSAADTLSYLNVTEAGTYSVQVFRQCDTLRDTMHVHVESDTMPDLGLGPFICLEGTQLLDPHIRTGKFKWSTGDTTTTLTVTQKGKYKLEVTGKCGTLSDSVSVHKKGDDYLNMPADVLICSLTTVFLVPAHSSGDFMWNTGSTDDRLTVSAPGKYWATLKGYCDTITDTCNVRWKPAAKLKLPNDTVLCLKQSLLIDSKLSKGSLTWSTGETGRSIIADSAGLYSVIYMDDCDTLSDSIIIYKKGSEFLNSGNDTLLCHGVPLRLTPLHSPGKLQWFDGADSISYTLKAPGTYKLTLYGSCDTLTDSIRLSWVPEAKLSLGPDRDLCGDDTVMLSSGLSEGTFIWSDGPGLAFKEISDTGIYWLRYMNMCDTLADSIKVSMPELNRRGTTYLHVCDGKEEELEAVNSYDSYLWSTGQTQKNIATKDTGWFLVNMRKSGCIITDSFHISRLSGPLNYFPNSFTPNEDGFNDFFPFESIPDSKLWVYDRWGSLVYYGVEKGWDGRMSSHLLPEGVYFFIMHQKHCGFKATQGTVTLIR